jgi:3-oxoacyl-[acyl-carrier-protein] synthase-1
MSSDVHIVGVAARTPVGLTAEASAAAIRAGISRVGEHPFFVDPAGEALVCAIDGRLDPELLGAPRLLELARSELSNATQQLAGVQRQGPVVVLLSLPEERPGFGERQASDLLRALSDPKATPAGTPLDVRVVGRGHAGGFEAIEQAIRALQAGHWDIALVGGVDGYLEADTIEWLDRDRRLARSQRRGGFPPGEASAFVWLATDAVRQRLAWPSLAVVRAVACGHEVRDEASPEGLQGTALSEVFSRVAAELRPSERVDELYCDINDERPRTTDLGFALLRAGNMFRDGTDYKTPAGSIGDVGAASVPLNCVLAARAWARGYANGDIALVSGASWRGLRGALLLTRPGAR